MNRKTLKFIALIAFIVSAFLLARWYGLSEYLDQDKLRHWIDGFGVWGPFVYMLIYAIAPSFMMPGLPLTVIANAIGGHYADHCVSLWDNDDGFFKDLIMLPDGQCRRLDVFSWVGIIPLFACEVVGPRLLANVPRFAELLKSHAGGLFDGHYICACPATMNDRDEHLLSLVDHTMLPRILKRLLGEEEFLSRYGIRSVSRIHAERKDLGNIPGVGRAIIEYEPGESASGLFGGNSNWRGPIWMPTNFLLIDSLERFHRYLGDNYRVEVPCMGNREMTLKEVTTLLSQRLSNIFRRGENGLRPAFEESSPFQHDPYWKDLLLFNEYFHAETGRGFGASHQTG